MEHFLSTWFHALILLCKAAKTANNSKNTFAFNPRIFASIMLTSRRGIECIFKYKSPANMHQPFFYLLLLTDAIFRPTLDRIIFLFYFACVHYISEQPPKHHSIQTKLPGHFAYNGKVKKYLTCSSSDWHLQVSIFRWLGDDCLDSLLSLDILNKISLKLLDTICSNLVRSCVTTPCIKKPVAVLMHSASIPFDRSNHFKELFILFQARLVQLFRENGKRGYLFLNKT